MLKVQEYLKSGKTLENLSAEFGIKVNRHPVDPLVILNYDQIESPKMHPVVRECRGLTLELETWNVVARAFDRFFNYGEALELNDKFIWEDCTAMTKEDGSLMLLYKYNGTWRVNTRGSFAEYNIHECGKTWAELFWEALNKRSEDIRAGDYICHVFEFCSQWNKVVREYKESKAYLLAIIKLEDPTEEFDEEKLDFIAETYNFESPQRYRFKNADEVICFLQEQETKDPTFEGIVLRDKNNLRIKVKSKTYVALHQLKGNDNIFLSKNLIPFILAGEIDEVLTYFPEVKPRMLEVKEVIDKAYKDLHEVWWMSQDFCEQKAFAIYITKESKIKTPFTGILFTLRKDHGQIQNEDLLKAAWRNSADAIIKNLF